MKKIALVLFLICVTILVSAQQPTKMSLQGKLTNATTGAVIPSADLRIIITDSSGNIVYNHSHANAVSNGIFDILLGDSYDLNLSYNEDYNLSIYVGNSNTPIGGPYTFRGGQGQIGAGDLSTTESYTFGNLTVAQKITFALGEIIDNVVDGFIGITSSLRVTGNVYLNNTLNVINGNVGIGIASPNSKLHVNGNSYLDGDVNITGTLYGGSPVKVAGGLQLIPSSIPFSCNVTNKGSMYFDNGSNMHFICNGTSWNNYTGPQGPVGPAGQPASPYSGGLVGWVTPQWCMNQGNCKNDVSVITIAVHEGIDYEYETVIINDIVNDTLEETYEFTIKKIPSTQIVEITAEKGGGNTPVSETYYLSPSNPVYMADSDNYVFYDPTIEDYFQTNFALLSDGIIQIRMDADEIKVMETHSLGNFVARGTGISPHEVTVNVDVYNFGQVKTSYVVTLTDCQEGIITPAAQAVTLEPSFTEYVNVSYFLVRNQTLDPGAICNVTMKSPTGFIYDGPTEVYCDEGVCP